MQRQLAATSVRRSLRNRATKARAALGRFARRRGHQKSSRRLPEHRRATRTLRLRLRHGVRADSVHCTRSSVALVCIRARRVTHGVESPSVCSYSVEISNENGNCMKPSKFLFRLRNQIRTDQDRRLGKRDRKGILINRDWRLNHLQPWILQQMQRLRDRARESARTNRLFALPWELRTRILQLGRELGAATLIQRSYRGYSARSRGVARWAEVPYFSSWDRDDVSQRRAVTKWAPVVYLF